MTFHVNHILLFKTFLYMTAKKLGEILTIKYKWRSGITKLQDRRPVFVLNFSSGINRKVDNCLCELDATLQDLSVHVFRFFRSFTEATSDKVYATHQNKTPTKMKK